MAGFVKFIVFAHGNIIKGNSGPEYDRGPLKMVKIRVGSTYAEFSRKICHIVGIDPTCSQVEIIHRLRYQMTHGVSYSAIPIKDDDDIDCLIDVAKEWEGRIYPDLYVKASKHKPATQVNTVTNPTVKTQSWCDHVSSLSSDLFHIPNPDTPCYRCQHPRENWLCLSCKVVLCSRYVNKHMLQHYQQTNHCLALSCSDLSVWCYSCHAYMDAQVLSQLRPVYETAYIDDNLGSSSSSRC